MIGKTVSHYSVLEKLGSGGMGVVYKAEDIKLKRIVALKFLPEELTRDQQALQRFQREAEAASGLNHPNICTIHDIDEAEGQPFIVMELLEGQMLRDLIAGQRLNVDRIIEFGTQIADALEAAHARGIVHRDIKPTNIFVTQRGQAKILDFGLAKLAPWMVKQKAGDAALPTVGITSSHSGTLGTLGYMSPEQARGEELDARSDLFSLGAVLYEMSTGRPAFPGNTTAVIFDAILNREPVSAMRLNPGLAPRLAEIINKALEKDREIRYQHASEIRADLKRLKRDSDSMMPAAAAAAVPPTPSARSRAQSRKEPPVFRIAVLPFENSGGNPDTEFLSDGITESLISSLSQLPNLRVISRTSVFRYKGAVIEPRAVGRELSVSAILAGRMIIRGDSISVSLELIDARDNSFIWGARFNRNITDIVAVEEEIAKGVAEKLQVKLTGTEKKHLAKRTTHDPEAYQFYLKGRYYWNKRTEESLRKGLEYFNMAIEKDPGYALAYAGVADSYAMLVWNIMISARDGLPKARAAAMKALEIDKRLAEAHASLAFVRLFYDWDWPGAEREFQHTIELNPNYAIARQWYAMELAALGRHEEAVRETERALQLDPLSLSINTTTGLLFYLVHKTDAALEQCHKTIELDANFFPSHFVCGCAYEQTGNYQEALEQFEAAVELSNRLPRFLAALGHGFATAGKRPEAEKVIEEILSTPKQKYRSSYCLAEIYAGLEENDRALEWLEKAYDERGTWMIFLKVHPIFESLHGEKRFQDILRHLGLVPRESTDQAVVAAKDVHSKRA